jgi:hypothetical protein
MSTIAPVMMMGYGTLANAVRGGAGKGQHYAYGNQHQK